MKPVRRDGVSNYLLSYVDQITLMYMDSGPGSDSALVDVNPPAVAFPL